MKHIVQVAGLLALVAVVSAGCGNKTKPEIAEPVAVPPVARHTPAAPSGREGRTQDPQESSARATLEQRIAFAFDRSDISPEARSILSAKSDVLRRARDITLRIEGHADERGSDEYNLALSQRRAAAAKRFLIQQGIAPERLETVSYGEERPLDRGQGESAWAVNRRAEFRVTSGNVAQR